mgnify:CR=1 FL=1|tara:strand:- start:20910 stop:21245 length:336 start_codon:yes stop_codon:yes gene_type:complete
MNTAQTTTPPARRIAQILKGSALIALGPFILVACPENITAAALTFLGCTIVFILIDLVFGGDLNHAIRTRYATQIAKVKKALGDSDFHALITLPAVCLAGFIIMTVFAVSQ